jgi:streptogramin lyase
MHNGAKAGFRVVRLTILWTVAVLIAGTFIALGTRLPARASSLSNISDFYVPVGGADPWGTAFDSSGQVWVAFPGCDGTACSSSSSPGKLGLFDPATDGWVTVVSLPTGYGQPLFVAVDSTGKVWFTMPATNSIGVYNPVSTTVTQWAVPTPSAGPWGIAIDSAGKIWFTEHYVNKIGSFNPASQTFNEVATPAANSNPYGISVDSANNVWFTENTDAVALIGEFTSSGVLQEYKIRNTPTAGTGLTPHLITVTPNGTIWWSEGFVSAIATLNPAAAQPGTNTGVTEYSYTLSCGTCGSHTSGIAADGLGNIWFDDSNQNTFGSLPVGGGTFSIYNSPTQNSHPHDGLNVDSQNRVLFDEEFANKIAVALQSGSATPTPTTTPTSSPTSSPTTSPTSSPTTSPTSSPGTVLGTDTFQRGNQPRWGTASDGQTWGGDANAASVFSVSGDAGVVSNTGGTSYSAVLGPSATDAEVYATGSLSSFTNSNFGDVLRWTDSNDWYKAYIDGQSLVVQKKVAGNTTTLAHVPFTAAAGTAYSIHFRVVGSTLTANVWPATGAEPSGWQITVSDSSLTAGRSGLRFLTQGGTAMITAFQAGVPGSGTTSPTPTPTTSATTSPTSSPTSSPTPTPTTSPTSSPGTALGTDTFQRANQTRWGTASDGQTWGGDANTSSVFAIKGNAGIVINTSGNSYGAVLGPAAADAEVYATGSLSSFTNSNFGDVLRWTDGNDWYKAYLDGQSLVVQKKVAGVTTILAHVPFAATAGVRYVIHFRVLGSTLTANAWAATGSEPAGWMVTAIDTSLTSGQAGLRFLTQTGTATITAFQADAV